MRIAPVSMFGLYSSNNVKKPNITKNQAALPKQNVNSLPNWQNNFVSFGLRKRETLKYLLELKEENNGTLANCKREDILTAAGVRMFKNRDGSYTLTEYSSIVEGTKLSDLGADEEKLLENVTVIEKNADFRGSDLEEVPSLKKVNGYLFLNDSKIKRIPNLRETGNVIHMENSEIDDIGSLKSAGGNIIANGAKINNMGSLVSVDGHFEAKGAEINDVHSLARVRGNLLLRGAKVHSNLDNLVYVAGNINMIDTDEISMNSLYEIGGNGNFEGTKTKAFPSLVSVGGNLNVSNSEVADLNNLQEVGNNIRVRNSKLTGLPSLIDFGGKADILDYSKYMDDKIIALRRAFEQREDISEEEQAQLEDYSNFLWEEAIISGSYDEWD